MFEQLEPIFQSVDAVLLTGAENLHYFTGFRGGEGIALLGKTGGYLFVDSRYTVEANRDARDVSVIEYQMKTRNAQTEEKLRALSVHTLGFEGNVMTVDAYTALCSAWQSVEWVDCQTALTEIRMVKNEEELALLRRAEQIGVDAYLRVLPMIKPGVRECEIAAELEYQMRKLGADGTSFETIVVSGVKSSMPHGKPDTKKIENGDFVTMDFGCRVGGYCSDMTRTVVVGKASEEQKKVYDTVKRAQQTGLDAIRAGILGAEADKAARDVIAAAGYGAYFGHSLGHGVGLLIHELPNLSPGSKVRLREGMIVTCEPGIYIPDFGGVRIEDMVCVREDGIENLTHLSKELLEL